MKKFIIEYSPRWCRIEEYDDPIWGDDLKEQYEYARDRLGKKDKDIFGYNNAFLGMIIADNPAEALEIFLEKQIREDSKRHFYDRESEMFKMNL